MIDDSRAPDILARTAWGEARGEGDRGMQAVMGVVLNRAAHPRWWGNSVVSVCLEPFQFSCWNSGDLNRDKLLAVTEADTQFVAAKALASEAIAGRLTDITGGADSYYAIGSPTPAWVHRATRTVIIGRHVFFRVELPAPSGFPDAPTRSVYAPVSTADQLNAAELGRLQPLGGGA